MADFGSASERISTRKIMSASSTTNTSNVSWGVVAPRAATEVDYAFLAGIVGQGIVAAKGGTPVTVTTKGASGAFDAQKIASIIGQQIAAAISAH